MADYNWFENNDHYTNPNLKWLITDTGLILYLTNFHT